MKNARSFETFQKIRAPTATLTTMKTTTTKTTTTTSSSEITTIYDDSRGGWLVKDLPATGTFDDATGMELQRLAVAPLTILKENQATPSGTSDNFSTSTIKNFSSDLIKVAKNFVSFKEKGPGSQSAAVNVTDQWSWFQAGADLVTDSFGVKKFENFGKTCQGIAKENLSNTGKQPKLLKPVHCYLR